MQMTNVYPKPSQSENKFISPLDIDTETSSQSTWLFKINIKLLKIDTYPAK